MSARQSEKAIRNALQAPAYREWKSLRAVRAAENGPITHFVMVASEVGNPRSAIDTSNPGLATGLRG